MIGLKKKKIVDSPIAWEACGLFNCLFPKNKK